MYNYFVVRITNRMDGTVGKTVKEYEEMSEALKDFFRQAEQAADATHLTDAVTMLTKEGFELRHEFFVHKSMIPVPVQPVEEVAE